MKWHSDLIGIGTSAFCTVHCALLPLLVGSLPVAGINLLENVWLELGTITLAFIAGAVSFYRGCFKKHKNKRPLWLFLVGFCLLVLNLLNEHGLLVLGASTLIITAHSWNYRLLRRHLACAA